MKMILRRLQPKREKPIELRYWGTLRKLRWVNERRLKLTKEDNWSSLDDKNGGLWNEGEKLC